jgi:hypothetical protein
MKNIRFCLFTIFLLAFSYQVSERTDISKPGVYELHLKAKRNTVRCSIKVIPYSPYPNMPKLENGWGSDRDTSWVRMRTMFREIRLWVHDNEIKVPLSCYADLINPVDANLLVTKHGYRLDVEGADAALSYKVAIDFDSKRVLKRAVHDVGGYAGVWEETFFHVDTTAWNY